MSKRGWVFFLMDLARALGMTRRQLLNNLDSYELELWRAYLNEMNKMPEKKQSREEIEGKLKNLMVAKTKGKKKHA